MCPLKNIVTLFPCFFLFVFLPKTVCFRGAVLRFCCVVRVVWCGHWSSSSNMDSAPLESFRKMSLCGISTVKLIKCFPMRVYGTNCYSMIFELYTKDIHSNRINKLEKQIALLPGFIIFPNLRPHYIELDPI